MKVHRVTSSAPHGDVAVVNRLDPAFIASGTEPYHREIQEAVLGTSDGHAGGEHNVAGEAAMYCKRQQKNEPWEWSQV